MTMDEASSVSEAYVEHETIKAIFDSEPPPHEENLATLAESIEEAIAEAVVEVLDEVVFGASSSQTVTEHEAISAMIQQVSLVATAQLLGSLRDRQSRLAAGIADAPSASVCAE